MAYSEKHKELLTLLNPLIDFMRDNDISYFLVAGKDGICSRQVAGNRDAIAGMLSGLIKDNKEARKIIEISLIDDSE